jgi:hypothetical protein
VAVRLANVFSAPGTTPIIRTVGFCSRCHDKSSAISGNPSMYSAQAKTDFAKKNKNNVDRLSGIQVKTTSSSQNRGKLKNWKRKMLRLPWALQRKTSLTPTPPNEKEIRFKICVF